MEGDDARDLEPTQRQLEVLEVFTRIPTPTLREAGVLLGIKSTNGVTDHVKALVRKRLLVHHPLIARSLRVTDLGHARLGRAAPERTWCDCFASALSRGTVTISTAGTLHIKGAYGCPDPIKFCPWCGRKL